MVVLADKLGYAVSAVAGLATQPDISPFPDGHRNWGVVMTCDCPSRV